MPQEIIDFPSDTGHDKIVAYLLGDGVDFQTWVLSLSRDYVLQKELGLTSPTHLQELRDLQEQQSTEDQATTDTVTGWFS